VAERDDPERLIAEALRARGGYGLLSGDVGLPLPAQQAETARVGPAPGQATRRLEQDRRVSAPSILLLAIMLGLAAGAVAGLLTLL
jgi:hypothetical protein